MLLKAALRSPLKESPWLDLFEYDAKFLQRLSAPKRVDAQFALLLTDTEKLSRKSHTMVKICLTFCNFVYKSSCGIDCVRKVFAKLFEEKIGVFYKQTYETWALLELKSGDESKAMEVLQSCLKYNVLSSQEQVEESFKNLRHRAASEAPMVSEPTITFSTDTSSRESGSAMDEDEPTVNFQPRASQKANAAYKLPQPLTKAKKSKLNSSKKVVPPKPKAGLGRLGGAVRVKSSSESVAKAFQKEMATNLTRVTEEVDFTQDETKERDKTSNIDLRKKLGDMSYIKNWKPPDMHGSSARVNTDEPTIMFNQPDPGHNRKRESINSKSSADGTPTMAFNRAQATVSRRKSEDRVLEVASSQEPKLERFLNPKSMFTVNGRSYLRLALIGRGGSSKVFKVLALSEEEPKICALKRIKLQRIDKSSLSSFENEIALLESLRGKANIVELFDSEINLENKVIYVVMEHGEIDLNKLLSKERKLDEKDSASNSLEIAKAGALSFNFIRLTWMNMLQAVHTVHEERIVHGDLKPANFLFVQGKLKLIDFGIAKEIANDTVNIVRDTQVGTINFMSPEAIVGQNGGSGVLKIGRASDVWSLGCILYQMVYGHAPFQKLKIFEKLRAIPNDEHEIEFPPTCPTFLEAMKECLHRDPEKRATIPELCKLWDECLISNNAKPSVNVQVQEESSPLSDENVQANRQSQPKRASVLKKRVFSSSDLFKGKSSLKKAEVAKPSAMQSLQEQIKAKREALKSLSSSKSSAFMKEKPATPEFKKNDLGYILRRGLERKFEHVIDQDETRGDNTGGFTWNFE